MIKKLLLIILLACSFTAVSQKKSIEKLVASPNPFAENTKIRFYSNTEQIALITVKNVLGKTVFTKEIKVKNGENLIPFRRNDLASGMYIYAIQTSKEIVSKRFVIK